MDGLMMDVPLSLNHIFGRAEKLFPEKEVVTATPTGKERLSYGDWARRTRCLGGVLNDLGISEDGRVATFAWNNSRHLELYFAPSCSGRVVHTLNLRLFPDQLTYIVNHAEDEVIFLDQSVAGLIWPLMNQFETLKHVVLMDDGAPPPDPSEINANVHDYEELLGAAEPVEWKTVEENKAGSMMYTSGTTGNPKGVVYSHRSMVLHTFGVMMADTIGINERDVLMPVVPMFHANSWGIAHAGVATGATLVMPGADLSPPALATLIEEEKVTVAAGVPTIWMGVLPELEGRDTSALRSIPCGGSAVPKSLSEGYRKQTGLPILQAWGMTETSPIAAVCNIKSSLSDLDEEAKADLRTTVGLAVPGVDFRVVEPETGEELPWDNESRGELQVSGPWVAKTYYNDERAGDSFTEDGWLKTGDVALIQEDGFLRIVDRKKDMILVSGFNVYPNEVEDVACTHPGIVECAAVGVPDDKSGEAVKLFVVKSDDSLTAEQVIAHCKENLTGYKVPRLVEFRADLPKTNVGKILRRELRGQ